MTKKTSALRIVGDTSKLAVPQPHQRGRLWYDFQIPDQFLSGLPGIKDKIRWVRSHLPRTSRIQVGRASAWHETDIVAYLEAERGRVAS